MRIRVTTTAINQIPLGRRRANAATIAAQRGTTALRLALVVLEDKEIVGARSIDIRAHERLIRECGPPTLIRILANTHAIVRSYG